MGFTLTIKDEKTLQISWQSGHINSRNWPHVGDRLPPPEVRPTVVTAIEAATGYKVVQ